MTDAAADSATLTPARDVRRFVRVYAADEVVFAHGARGTSMFVVVNGRVAVERADGSRLAELGPGEFFGEMALVGEGVRAATVRALDAATQLAEIDRARFIYLVGQQPAFSLTVMRVLAERLGRAQAV